MGEGPGRLGLSDPICGGLRWWVLLGTLISLLCLPSCDATPTGPQDKRVGSEGGSALLEDGAIQLLVPSGALTEPVWFTAFTTLSVPPSPLLVPETVWELGPMGTTFSRPVTLSVAYDPAKLPEGIGEEGLALYQVRENQWFLLDYGTVDSTANTVAGGIQRLGRFGIKGMTLTGVEVSPAATTLAPGGSVQLSAAPKGEDGRTLSSRPVTWSSSDTGTATVDSTGTVTGISEGTATVTASSETHQATSSIHVRIPVATVEISPADGSVSLGRTLQLTATVRDAAGTELAGRTVIWSSSNPQVLTVDTAGMTTGRSLGSAIVTATVEGKAGMGSVSVHGDLRISTERLATAVVGMPYDQTLAAAGGNGAYQWALASGSFPAGLNLNPQTGAIGGTPTSASADTFSVRVASAGQTAEKSLSIQVSPTPVASVQILPASANLAVGDSILFSATARDASGTLLSNPSPVWSSSDEAVATVSSEGRATGIAPGSATTSASVDGFPAWASVRVLSLLAITDSTLADGIVSRSYADTLVAAGGDGDYAWSLVEDSLPSGLALDDTTGMVLGTPTAADSSMIRVAVESGDGQADTVTVALVVREELRLASTTLAEGVEAAPYADTLLATGGKPPYRWSVTAGSLPPGMTLGVSTGVINGTPSNSGASSFRVGVESDDQQADTTELVLTVRPSPVASVTLSPASATITVGDAHQLTATPLDAAGGALTGRTVTWTTADGLIARVDETGLVTAEGVGTTSVTATSEGISASAIIAVHAVLGIANGSLNAGSAGIPYEETLAATGGNGVYSWAVSEGALPAGLSLEGATGVISGTPVGAGTSGFTIRVTSGDGQTATRALSITNS